MTFVPFSRNDERPALDAYTRILALPVLSRFFAVTVHFQLRYRQEFEMYKSESCQRVAKELDGNYN